MKGLKATKIDDCLQSGFSVLIENKKIKTWVDVWVYNEDVICDWNAYIFNLKDSSHLAIKEFQENGDNFEECTSLAVSKLEQEGKIKQENGKWYYV
jgi:hypothetical protein